MAWHLVSVRRVQVLRESAPPVRVPGRERVRAQQDPA
jgi:hypothetical protein